MVNVKIPIPTLDYTSMFTHHTAANMAPLIVHDCPNEVISKPIRLDRRVDEEMHKREEEGNAPSDSE
jgi:hypothetical protein